MLSGGQAGGKKASVIWRRRGHGQRRCCYQEEDEVSSWKRSDWKRWWSYQTEMESAPPGSDLETNIIDQSVLCWSHQQKEERAVV